MRSSLLILALCLATAVSAPRWSAAEEPAPQEQPGQFAREGVERLMRALNALIEMIPQYELPEMNEDGDIIIRRKRAPEEEPSFDDPEVEETDT